MEDNTWIMACDVPLFPNSPLSSTARCSGQLKKRRRTYGDFFDGGDKEGDFAAPTSGPRGQHYSTSVVTSSGGDSTSVTSSGGDSTSFSVTSSGGDSTSFSVTSGGDSTSVTSGGDSTSVTSGDQSSTFLNDMTIQEFKRQARNRREQQRSVLISKQMMKLGEVIREANVVPLPPMPLKKIEVVTLAIDTIRALQAKIQTHTQGGMPAVVCG